MNWVSLRAQRSEDPQSPDNRMVKLKITNYELGVIAGVA